MNLTTTTILNLGNGNSPSLIEDTSTTYFSKIFFLRKIEDLNNSIHCTPDHKK